MGILEDMGINIGIGYNTLLFWGGVILTVSRFLIKNKQGETIGTYGVAIGIVWYFLSNTLGLI